MDFSSVPRALDSLFRRQPSLDDVTLQCAAKLKNDDTTAASWLEALQQLLSQVDTDRWEPLAVSLFVATEALLNTEQEAADVLAGVYMDGPRVPSMQKSETDQDAAVHFPALDKVQTWKLCETLHTVAMQHLEHKEPRVRTLVAKAVGAYCQVTIRSANWVEIQETSDSIDKGALMRQQVHHRLLSSIHQHIVEGRQETKRLQEQKLLKDASSTAADTKTEEKEQAEQYSRSSTGALDDTTGWRALETNWLCLAALIRAMGPHYLEQFHTLVASDDKQDKDQQDDPERGFLADAEYSCITHVNRHVRAAGMAVLEQCVVAVGSSPAHYNVLLNGGALRITITKVLKTGLADNWSQVRMAASVLCRVLFVTLSQISQDNNNDDLYAVLLPRMLLNRFYLAQGVKLYSHETWKMLFPAGGLERVVQYLPAVCRYYVQMCDADNHVVREGACQAIAELAVRMTAPSTTTATDYRNVLQPQVSVLLQALLMCFHDESWPVRDEACLACAILCKAFPEDCHPELKTLWERWTEQLTDQIWSVRQDAAVGLGDALEAYGSEIWVRLQKELIPAILPAARQQPSLSREAYKAHVNDAEAHTGAQMYSCGSLAPKLQKTRKDGAGRIGCTNCGIDRPKAPWEATDGCIYLLRELCIKSNENPDHTVGGVVIDDKVLLPLLTELADVCRVDHFPQADELRTTLWRQLPAMFHALGKQRVKNMYLEIFMELLFRDLQSRSASQLAQHAAGQCAAELAQLVGVSIFRGRLELDSQRACFDRVLQERANMPKGPADAHVASGKAFSPFEPPGLLDHIKNIEGIHHPGSVGAALGRFP